MLRDQHVEQLLRQRLRQTMARGWSGSASAPAANLPLSDISGWYDASVIDNIGFSAASGSGEKIDEWTDLGGSFRHFGQSTDAVRPRWYSGIQNGHGAILFDRAAATFLDRSAIIVGSDSGSLYLTLKCTDLAGTHSGLWTMGSDFQDDAHTSNLDRLLNGAGSTARKTVTTGGSQPVVRTWHLLEIHSAPGDWQFLIDGVEIHQTATNTTGWPSVMQLGTNGADAWGGYFGEFVAYNVDHGEALRLDTRSYMGSKWGTA